MYSYELPSELIANVPAEPRDSARLFVHDTKTGKNTFDAFAHVADYLPSPSLLVTNDTKVVPARLTLSKSTGGKVETLFLMNEWKGGKEPFEVMADRKILIGDVLKTANNSNDNALESDVSSEFKFEVVAQNEHIFSLKPQFEPGRIFDLLNMYGLTPVPKYIKNMNVSESELRQRYQTVFAENPASVAAPTASLHFTDKVFKNLQKKGIKVVHISLHVGLGTFAPINEENLENGTLHTERFEVSAESGAAILHAKKSGIPIIAVGTTVVRALESFVLGKTEDTNIFIRPPYEFKIVDHLITNFHLPNSSLMMLAEAFLQYKKSPRHLVDLYNEAIANKFRFYSFGDSMFIW